MSNGQSQSIDDSIGSVTAIRKSGIMTTGGLLVARDCYVLCRVRIGKEKQRKTNVRIGRNDSEAESSV